MCGIFCLILHNPTKVDIDPFLESLHHRGPDDKGALYWQPGSKAESKPALCSVALGQTRLSIIDLTNAGHQPMVSEDGRWWIVLNGEVYNYLELRSELEGKGNSFRTSSDTEVVLKAIITWGPEVAFSRFIGMFALALLDTFQKKIIVARDPFGIKPFFYCHWSGGLAFSSEIWPLLNLPGVDQNLVSERVFEYLRFGIIDYGDGTLVNGVKQIPPASWGEINLENSIELGLKKYWDIKKISQIEISFNDAVQLVREKFLRNIELHMRSDVPVGMALSGGLDSSSIVCAARFLYPNKEIHTFSYIPEDSNISEEHWIKMVTNHAKTVSHVVKPESSDFEKDVLELIKIQGEPFGSTSIYAQYCIFQSARKEGIPVLLDGQGADEILGGYVSFQGARLASLVRKKDIWGALNLFKAQKRFSDRDSFQIFQFACQKLLPVSFLSFSKWLVNKNQIPGWLNKNWFSSHGIDFKKYFHKNSITKCLRDALEESISFSMLPHLLRYEDRNSMAFSIESRVPFLTKDFVSFLLSLPEEYIIGKDGENKKVFREAMRGIVPEMILKRRDKLGFVTPEKKWLKNNNNFSLFNKMILLSENIKCFNFEKVKEHFNHFFKEDSEDNFCYWRILNFIAFHNLIYKEV
ncbi:MAG: asparagine synthase (glutamine-hydrolyzing) [Candidatus Riflebacteria bacterium]|nr:asparagine synthase (glutamine-hydrolyzing) [Candidatus Riflebacteria bacterium]